jgi:hypothetical protein
VDHDIEHDKFLTHWSWAMTRHDPPFDTAGLSSSVRKAYEAALEHGRLPLDKWKLLIMGAARVGKTSLKRALSSQHFREDSESTKVRGRECWKLGFKGVYCQSSREGYRSTPR